LGQALLWQTGGVNPNLLSARAARADLMKKAYPLLTAAELVNPPPSRVRVRVMVRLGFLTQTLPNPMPAFPLARGSGRLAGVATHPARSPCRGGPPAVLRDSSTYLPTC
jgi:hypothetical protein